MIKQSTLFLICSSTLLFLSLIGCANLSKNYPERNYYILSVSNNNHKPSSDSGAILEIRGFETSPSFGSREFVYKIGDLSYVSDFYNQFFRPPGQLITEQIRKWFSESGLFKNVVDPSNNVEPDYTLEGNVSELYGDFRSSNTPKAVLGIQFFLISKNSKILFQNNYREEIVLNSNSPQDLANGWNEALEQILTALSNDLKNVDFKPPQ